MIVSSCGKKQEIKDGIGEKTTTESESLNYVNALKALKEAVTKNDIELLKKTLLSNPSLDINQAFVETGETPLVLSIKKDHREIRNYLIYEREARVSHPDDNRITPLMAAAIGGHLNSAVILLNEKAELETRDPSGDTALHLALKNARDQVALYLIKQGANINTLDSRSRNALRLAQEYNAQESLRFIRGVLDLEFGAPDITSYRKILEEGDHQTLSRIVSRYPIVATDPTYDSINPLSLLVNVKNESNGLKSAEILIENQANVDGPQGIEQTPLIKATVKKKSSFVKLFLSAKAKTELKDEEGKSALIHAVEQNNLELVNLLVSYSANEKYSFRRNGRTISFNSCDVARKVQKTLKTEEEKETNRKIRKSLSCGFLGIVL